MPDPLGIMTKIEVRRQWPNEATDFTPWLAKEENLAELGKALGIEMEVERVEAAVGPYSADILAKNPEGQYIIIENQLEKTNHDHLGKAITYGSVLGATAIVWIATQFTEEHRRALGWLNDNTTEELSFYGVLVELWKIDDSRPAVQFNVICRPAVIKPSEAGTYDKDLTGAKKLQLDFWTAFAEKLLEKGVVPSAQTPRPQYWFNIALGKSGVYISNIANTEAGRVGVRVYIDKKVAKLGFKQLLAQKEEIEKELGEQLEWDPNPQSQEKSIALNRDTNLHNRNEWPDAIEWLVDRTSKFRTVFMPRVKRLQLSAPPSGEPSGESL